MTDPGYAQGRPDYGAAPTQGYQGQTPGYPGQGPAYPGQGPAYPGQGQGAGYADQGAAYAQGTGFPPAPPQQQFSAGSKGFVASLFDVQFDSFVTPKIIRVLYVIWIVLISIGTLGLAISGFATSTLVGILVLVIICPLYFFFSLALSRVVLEIFMVVFRMADDIRALRERGGAS
jgi:hypothetical protein